MRPSRFAVGLLAAVVTATAASCGSDETASEPVTLTLVAYDSFPTEGTTLNDALAEFTASTGIGVEILIAGEAGTMVSKAVLTAGTPEGDAMFGVDNTLLSRVIEADVFEPYEPEAASTIDPALVALVPGNELTPVDFGDVCVNYDLAWLAEHDLDPPETLADLIDPEYRDLLVVEDPAASSPGLAFLLATVAEFGADGWQDYWRALRANGVDVADSWTSAYYERFSGSAGAGPRPLVVSYGTSPPAEVVFADPPRTEPPTGVAAGTCFRQVEFAGVLRGTEHEDEAQQLVDHLVGASFQRELPLNLFVYPARTDVELPDVFRFAVRPGEPRSLEPDDIAAHRDEWVDEWTQIVVR